MLLPHNNAICILEEGPCMVSMVIKPSPSPKLLSTMYIESRIDIGEVVSNAKDLPQETATALGSTRVMCHPICHKGFFFVLNRLLLVG